MPFAIFALCSRNFNLLIGILLINPIHRGFGSQIQSRDASSKNRNLDKTFQNVVCVSLHPIAIFTRPGMIGTLLSEGCLHAIHPSP